MTWFRTNENAHRSVAWRRTRRRLGLSELETAGMMVLLDNLTSQTSPEEGRIDGIHPDDIAQDLGVSRKAYTGDDLVRVLVESEVLLQDGEALIYAGWVERCEGARRARKERERKEILARAHDLVAMGQVETLEQGKQLAAAQCTTSAPPVHHGSGTSAPPVHHQCTTGAPTNERTNERTNVTYERTEARPPTSGIHADHVLTLAREFLQDHPRYSFDVKGKESWQRSRILAITHLATRRLGLVWSSGRIPPGAAMDWWRTVLERWTAPGFIRDKAVPACRRFSWLISPAKGGGAQNIVRLLDGDWDAPEATDKPSQAEAMAALEEA